MKDYYSHIDNSIIYIEENIPGPLEKNDEYRAILAYFNSQLTDYCQCLDICKKETCKCLRNSGGENYFRSDGQLCYTLNFDKKVQPVFECNSLCSCSENCGNRIVQKGPIENLKIAECEDKTKGFGLFTKSSIFKGTFICEYAGELITKYETSKRHNINCLTGRMNYIYCLNEYSNGRNIQTFIDPSKFGNIGRYINHSCRPNSIIVPVRVDSPIPKLSIFSCKDILSNSEITFDYGTDRMKNQWEHSNCDIERKKCLCMSKNCKGFMPFQWY